MVRIIFLAMGITVFTVFFLCCMIEAGIYAYRWIDTKITNRFGPEGRYFNKGDDSLWGKYLGNAIGGMFFLEAAILLTILLVKVV